MKYGIRCPECGLLIKRIDNIKDVPKEMICYGCEKEFEVIYEEIEILKEKYIWAKLVRLK